MWSALQACFMIWHLQYIDFIVHHYEKKEICSMTVRQWSHISRKDITHLHQVLLFFSQKHLISYESFTFEQMMLFLYMYEIALGRRVGADQTLKKAVLHSHLFSRSMMAN